MSSDYTSSGAPILQILFFFFIGITVLVATLRQKRVGQKRTSDLQNLAARWGIDFNPNRDESFALGWGFLSGLNQGDKRYAFNILRGTYQEQALFIFDYHYQTGSGKSTEQHNLTMLMLVFKEVFPQVTIEPHAESMFAKMTAAFGCNEYIKFESADFSQNFCVRSQDKKFAYDVCNPQMIEYLLANRALRIEIQGPAILLVFEPQLPVEQIESNLQRLIEIRAHLPNYLFTNA